MSAAFVAAIDQGTTGTRCIVFDERGKALASAYEELSQHYPKPGWVEHDAREIWFKTKRVIGAALDKWEIGSSQLRAVGITNQRETTIVWDRETGEPLADAIVWQDTRTSEICERLTSAGLGNQIRSKTGLPVATYFSGPKLKWLLDNVPGLRERGRDGRALFGTVDSWLVWNLIGEHVTDYTNASRTMLANIVTGQWDSELLEWMDIPRGMLPRIDPSIGPVGTTRGSGPFAAELPVAGILGDQQAALFGQTCFQPGQAKNTYGTGSFMLLNTGGTPVLSEHGLITTIAYASTHQDLTFALEGSIAVTGAAVQWLRDNLRLIKSVDETEILSQSVPDTAGVYFVPAFSGLFAPHWDLTARGVIVGLTAFSERAHLIRATLEAICYQTREVLDAMEADWAAQASVDSPGRALKSFKVDGGASRNDFLMQLQADILGVPIIRSAVSETTALGAAFAAGLGAGVWEGLSELAAQWQPDRVFEPQWSEDRRGAGYAAWQRAVARARGWQT